MIRAGLITSARSVGRGAVKVVAGGTIVGATGAAAYLSTEQGKGMRRELQFWSGVAPVVFDYYWNFAGSSPKVKYEKWLSSRIVNHGDDDGNEQEKEAKKQKLRELHQRHAPKILDVLLDLKGLYVKLGQVLSVTTLPVPETYREKFRTLQSDVPGWEEFDLVVKPTLERELGRPLEEVFASIDPVPCGAASIGQAHKAMLLRPRANKNNDKTTSAENENQEVIIKVQYPDAQWQIPADIQCVGDLMKICVFFGVVDQDKADLSFNEFSRQFIAELDYDQERRNLEDIYKSSLDPNAPYQARGVIVPHVYPDLCTSKVITMSYLPGPKLEAEARRQLAALGIDTGKGIRSLIKAPTSKDERSRDQEATNNPFEATKTSDDEDNMDFKANNESTLTNGWKQKAVQLGGKVISVDSLLGTVRLARRMQVWCTATAVKTIDVVSRTPVAGSLIPSSLSSWAEDHSTASQQANRLALTKEWIDALFEVHGHQIFKLGCFNADCHPGNILVVDEESNHPKLGLIDFGQCKRLTNKEQAQVARLLVCVANQESDEAIAAAFRDMGIQTRNDSTEFLAKFAKLMFGPLQSCHLDHAWHKEMHQQDSVTYFPNQLSMVYRTSMLLRGLAVSLQFNVSIGDSWKGQAQEALERYDAATAALTIDKEEKESSLFESMRTDGRAAFARRVTAAGEVAEGMHNITLHTN